MGVLVWLESLPLSVWVHESPSVWAQPTVLTLHTMGMGVLVGASWVLDLRLLGISRNVPLSAFRWVFRAVAVSLIVNVVTGVLLFTARATTWGPAIPFFIKMCLVVASAATLVPLRSLVFRSDAHQCEVPGSARLLAIASIVAWSAAITSGRLLAYLVPGA
jgi:predicted ferric reductase